MLDTLDTHIAVINGHGEILYVNDAWIAFGKDNGAIHNINWLAYNYLTVCKAAAKKGDKHALVMVDGIESVITQQRTFFTYEYPCDSPSEKRWFLVRIAPLKDHNHRYVISHQNITRNKLLEQQALEDPLTELYNRRGFNYLVKEEFSRANRHKTTLSIIMMDVDFFKQYNDQHGHIAGDECLKSITKVIRQYTRRPGDIAARLGGDEFAVVLPQTSKEEARYIAELIREDIFKLGIAFDETSRITISAGVSSLTPDETILNADRIHEKADLALYSSKKKRNCVCLDEAD